MVQRVYAGVARDAGVPIVGLGGVRHWEQAAFVLAGATAIGIGTTLYHDHRAPRQSIAASPGGSGPRLQPSR